MTMNEDEFRRAVRAQVDAHINRLRITYSVLFGTGEALRRMAQGGGVDDDTIATVFAEEALRVEDALEEFVQPDAAQQQPARIH